MPHAPEIADEFISSARTVFYGVQHVNVVHCATPHITSLLACDSVGHGSWLGAAGQLLTHRSCAPQIRDSNIREHFDSNSTYHPAVMPGGLDRGKPPVQ